MTTRLYQILKENRSTILYKLIRQLRGAPHSCIACLSFDKAYSTCSAILEGYLEHISDRSSSILDNIFRSVSLDLASEAYSIEDVQQVFSALRAVCIPFLEGYHTPETRVRLKLDLESQFQAIVTLFTSIYHDAIVQSAKEESRMFELIFRESGDCIYSIDREKRIKVLNPAMEKFLGVKSSEVIGKKCHEVLRWKEKDRRDLCLGCCPIVSAFEKGDNTTYIEGLLEINKWRKRWVGTTASCVRDDEGRILEIILVMRDITASKNTQKKLEEEIKTFETLAQTTRGIELKIPCMSEYVITARAQAELIANRMKFNLERIQDIKSAVGEACDNAIEHGGSQRGVDIRYRMRGTNLLIEVEDYGEGFEPDKLGHNLPSPFVEGGRGLFLIRNLVDEMRVVSKLGQGTKLTMEIFRKPAIHKKFQQESSWRKERKICVM